MNFSKSTSQSVIHEQKGNGTTKKNTNKLVGQILRLLFKIASKRLVIILQTSIAHVAESVDIKTKT